MGLFAPFCSITVSGAEEKEKSRDEGGGGGKGHDAHNHPVLRGAASTTIKARKGEEKERKKEGREREKEWRGRGLN